MHAALHVPILNCISQLPCIVKNTQEIKVQLNAEIETADLSQSQARLNLSQFVADYLLLINSSTEIKNI